VCTAYHFFAIVSFSRRQGAVSGRPSPGAC
jgi:hypothetical protein